MKERPIRFNGEMVRAVLDGRKTQTRRVVKVQPSTRLMGYEGILMSHKRGSVWHSGPPLPGECPYGQVGDRLWVRETWHTCPHCESAWYAASDILPRKCAAHRWKPSIHMPRWACRIVLEITGVRVKRLRDISEADALAEGASPAPCGGCGAENPDDRCIGCLHPFYREGFHSLWDSIAKPGQTWADNPWVWVVEFKRVQP